MDLRCNIARIVSLLFLIICVRKKFFDGLGKCLLQRVSLPVINDTSGIRGGGTYAELLEQLGQRGGDGLLLKSQQVDLTREIADILDGIFG